MRAAHRPAGREALITADERGVCGPQQRRQGMVIYSLASGAVSLVAGAAVSLVASGTGRVVVWCAVSGGASVVAGLIYEPGLLLRVYRFLCGLVRP